MNENIIIEQMINIELKVSILYKIFSELFPEDSNFWIEMSEEEIEHKNFVEKNFDNIDKLFFNNLNITEREVNEINNYLDNVIRKYSSHTSHSKLEACEVAFKIESTTVELHVLKCIKKESEILNKLCSYDIEHLAKIMEIMKKSYINNGEKYDTLVRLGIKHEILAKDIYLYFASKFHSDKEAFLFFISMAEQEDEHKEELERIYEITEKEKLESKVDIIDAIESYIMLNSILNKDIKNVNNVEEAIDIAHQIENSEINIIFKNLIELFVDIEERKNFIFKQLEEHNTKLILFTNYLKNRNL